MAFERLDPDHSSLEVWTKAGDPRFVGLFLKLQAELRREIVHHQGMTALRRTHDPEDLLQAVFARALADERLRTGAFEHRGTGSLRAYLHTFVNSVIVDEIRKLSARKRNDARPPDAAGQDSRDELPGEGPPSLDPTPTCIARTHEIESRILAQLQPTDRTIWQLKTEGGLGFAAIARRIGTTESAVRSRYFRLKEELSQTIDQP